MKAISKTKEKQELQNIQMNYETNLMKVKEYWNSLDLLSMDEDRLNYLCQDLLSLIPDVMTNSVKLQPKISLNEQVFCHKNFRESEPFIKAEIKQGKQNFGEIEVHYKANPDNDSSLTFDRLLLEDLAERLALTYCLVEKNKDVEQFKEEALQAYDRTIEAWSAALDTQDKEASGHTKRVTDLALAMAEELDFKGEALDNVRRGALLHDIGKISIPDEIIRKPGKLTEDEFQIVKKHPIFAQKWLSQIDLLKPALQIPYYHHERWDGSGYPQGLAGEDIPLIARMFAVVDVWDALISDRPFRSAMTKEAALDLIVSESGKQFDPNIVELLLRVLAERDYLDTKYQIRIQSFGQARFWVQNRRITSKDWQVANARDLFFLFLAHHESLTKEQVGLHMWPDLSTDELDVRFKNTLYRLRRAVGNEVILLGDDGYRFNKMLDYFYDVETFETSYHKAQEVEDENEKLNFLLKAVRNYHGDYLPDVDTIWVMTDREHYRLTYINALQQIADIYFQAGDHQSSLNYADKVLAADPVSEDAHRLAMEIYASLGSRAGIIRQYEACCEALEYHFGFEPSEKTRDLYQKLVSDRSDKELD